MANTVQIVIEADESGAAASLDALNASAARLTPTLENVGATSDRTFNNTRVVTDLLTGNISRAEQALVRLGARTELLSPLIAAAFAPAAIVTFATLLETVPNTIDKVIEKFTGAKAALDAMNTSQAALNKNLEEMNKQIDEAQRKGAVIGMSSLGGAQTNLGFSQADAAKQQALVNSLSQQLAAMNKATVPTDLVLGTGEVIGGAGPAAPAFSQQDIQAVTAQLEEAQAKLALIKQDASNAGSALHEAFGVQAVDDLLADNKQFDDFMKKIADSYKEFQGFIGNTQQLSSLSSERGTAPASLMGMPIPSAADFDFLDTSMAKTTQGFQTLDQQMMVNIETDQKVAQQGQEDAKKYQEAWTRARDTMANQLDSFFNELTSGNIGQAFLKQFEKMVSQMVATWLMGIQGMQGAVTRSGGLFGDLGKFLGFGGGGGGGGIFGGGASAAGGALDSSIFSFSPSSAGFTGPEAQMLGLGLSAGGGGGTGLGLGSLPTGAMTLGPGLAGIGGGGAAGGGLLSSLASLLPIGALAGGAALLGKGGIAGAGGSGLLGYGAGALAGSLLPGLAESAFLSGAIGPGLTTALVGIAPFLGPIGAGIGLIAGLVGLFTGNGKRKQEQTAVLQQMQQALNNLQNAFNLHQVDYNSAISQAEQIRQSYTAQQESIQQGGGPSRVDPWVNATETYINNLEAQRQNTLSAVGGYGPAQFSEGGFVHPSMARMAPAGFVPAMHFAMGGAVPAIVHAGEYVLNAGAVRQIGVGTLDGWNSGGGGPAVHVHLSALEPRSFEQWMAGDGGRALFRAIARASNEGRA